MSTSKPHPIHDLGSVPVTRKTGEEQFHNSGNPIHVSVNDFWTWAHSDLLNNAARGVLAEILVASALDVADGTRIEWDAKDILSKSGVKIEVKSAAYIQSWKQEKLSPISFDIAKKYAWDSETNTTSETRVRSSDIYVFCLLDEKDQNRIDPLDLSLWRFYVVKSRRLDIELGDQKSISLSRLKALGASPLTYDELAFQIDAAMHTQVPFG